MSEKYLFGAEVDRIQDTLFRAARQRQVVGGSRLLAEFGEQAETLAQEYGADPKDDILITAGGRFSIMFPGKNGDDNGRAFGRQLANTYRLLLDASITVAEPVAVNGDFATANTAIQAQIDTLKRAGRGSTDGDQAPTTAFCQSSGVGLAASYKTPVQGEEVQYLSGFADRMAQAGYVSGRGQRVEEDVDDSFLGRINQLLPEPYKRWPWAANVDEVAAMDGERANVAYLVADGNDMGRLFNQCDEPDTLRKLSMGLDQATREAVAGPIPKLIEQLQEAGHLQNDTLPLLPLILAGDDVFVLLPAKYALDFARRFCLAFEEAIRPFSIDGHSPTMAAAVVICKGSYPYHLAHKHGETLLGRAKQLVKGAGGHYSAVAFDMIVGSEMVATADTAAQYRPSLNPYWVVAEDRELDEIATQAAITLDNLILHRWLLSILPQKRLAEIRELFAPETVPRAGDDLRQRWHSKLANLKDRIQASGSPQQLLALEQALVDLGDQQEQTLSENLGHWRTLRRVGEHYQAHGLQDLIEVWNYAQSLEWALADYEQEES